MHRAVDGNPQTVTSPPTLWLAALDKLLENMKAAKFPFERVASISGSGQQHGSVYWKIGAEGHLKSLQSDKVAPDQICMLMFVVSYRVAEAFLCAGEFTNLDG